MRSKKARHKKIQKGFRWWHVPAGLLGLVLALVVGLLAVLTIGEYNPKSNTALGIAVPGSAQPSPSQGDSFEILTWNIGYAGLSAEEDFFMDGGTKSRPDSRELVETNMDAIAALLQQISPEVIFLQEIDSAAHRSYNVDQVSRIHSSLQGSAYSSSYALNYKCAFVPIPIPPMGKVESGIMTLTQYNAAEAVRIPLPVSYTWPVRTAQLKRCLQVTRIPLSDSDKELVLVNLHLEAYAPEEAKQAQTRILVDFLKEEYAKGNYCIAGGDWNQTFPGVDQSLYPSIENSPFTAEVLPDAMLPDGWSYAFDQSVPTARLLNQPYDSTAENNQFYVIDGFMVSPNVTVSSVKALDLQFANSDHNPVLLSVTLKDYGRYSRAAIQQPDWAGNNGIMGIAEGGYEATAAWARDFASGLFGIEEKKITSCTLEDHYTTPFVYMNDGYSGSVTNWSLTFRNMEDIEERHTVQIIAFEQIRRIESGDSEFYTTTLTLTGALADDAILKGRSGLYAYLEQDDRFADQILGFGDMTPLPQYSSEFRAPTYEYPGDFLYNIFQLTGDAAGIHAVITFDSEATAGTSMAHFYCKDDLQAVPLSLTLDGYLSDAVPMGDYLLVHMFSDLSDNQSLKTYKVHPDAPFEVVFENYTWPLAEGKGLLCRDGDVYLVEGSKETLLLDGKVELTKGAHMYSVYDVLDENRFVFSAYGYNHPGGGGIYDLTANKATWFLDETGEHLQRQLIGLAEGLLFVDEIANGPCFNPQVIDLAAMKTRDLTVSFPDENGKDITDPAALRQMDCTFRAAGPDGKTVLFLRWQDDDLRIRVFDTETGKVLLDYNFNNRAASFDSIRYIDADTVGILCRRYTDDTDRLLELNFTR